MVSMRGGTQAVNGARLRFTALLVIWPEERVNPLMIRYLVA